MKDTKSPLVLTVNGKAELVVQDAASYQNLMERLEEADTVIGIQRGLEQMRQGLGRPVNEVFSEIPNGQKA
jgi:PHD/YefM family antitoxin component YafN of YafNO toxin-antitoxin module